jgi:hypothetical protein
MIIVLQKLAVVWGKHTNICADFFGENIYKIITSVPGLVILPTLCT